MTSLEPQLIDTITLFCFVLSFIFTLFALFKYATKDKKGATQTAPTPALSRFIELFIIVGAIVTAVFIGLIMVMLGLIFGFALFPTPIGLYLLFLLYPNAIALLSIKEEGTKPSTHKRAMRRMSSDTRVLVLIADVLVMLVGALLFITR